MAGSGIAIALLHHEREEHDPSRFGTQADGEGMAEVYDRVIGQILRRFLEEKIEIPCCQVDLLMRTGGEKAFAAVLSRLRPGGEREAE